MTPGDVVWVPFPHVEDASLHSRPALIVAVGLGGAHDLCWAAMITAAANPAWPLDVVIDDPACVGLPIASRIRVEKIATLPAAVATPVGRLRREEWDAVRGQLKSILGRRRQDALSAPAA